MSIKLPWGQKRRDVAKLRLDIAVGVIFPDGDKARNYAPEKFRQQFRVAVFDLAVAAIKLIFGWISLPAFPESLETTLTTYEDLIFDNLSMLSFFVRVSTVKVLVPLILIVVNFDKVYKLTMYILRKIPFIGVK